MKTIHSTLVTLMVAGVLQGAPALSLAQGEHARRASAELLVLQGDLRRLQDKKFSTKQKTGLHRRILGGLAGLDLLLRLADEEMGRDAQRYRQQVVTLRRKLEAKQFVEISTVLKEWSQRHPLRSSTTTASVSLKAVKGLHTSLCASCHDQPELDTQRPAFNLFGEAKRLGSAEFFARMLVGVRGDRVTGIDNPLNDAQINALITYYKNTTN